MRRLERFFGSLVGFALLLCTTFAGGLAAEEDDGPDEGDTMTVAFDELRVFKKGGRLTVRYAIDEARWNELGEANLDIWFRLLIPTRAQYPNDVVSYTARAPDHAADVRFPKWLDTGGVDTVALCILATGPNDQLNFGRGWICERQLAFDLDASKGPTGQIDATLVYHTGPPHPPYAPWMGPTPEGMPTPF